MNKRLYAILPNIIVPLGGLNTDIYLPSLPAMTRDFGVEDSLIQLTITAYVAAMALSQYIAGPVSDALGRKRLIVTSLLIQLLMNFIIIMAPSAIMIIIARFFQGLASAFMIVPARAMLNDCFTGDDLKKKFNYLTISFAIAPIIAPYIGGLGEHFIGWHAGFYFLITYIIILLCIILMFSEETIKQIKPFSFSHIMENYKRICTSRTFILPTLFISAMFGFTSIFAVLGPFIFQLKFNLSPLQYGYIALLIGFAWFLGNITNRLLFHVKRNHKVIFALLAQTLTILFLSITAGFHVVTATKLLIGQFILVYTAALVFPVFVADSLSYFTDIAASSNAFLFASTWLAFSLYSFLATLLPHENLMPFILIYGLVNIAGYCLFYLITKEDVYS